MIQIDTLAWDAGVAFVSAGRLFNVVQYWVIKLIYAVDVCQQQPGCDSKTIKCVCWRFIVCGISSAREEVEHFLRSPALVYSKPLALSLKYSVKIAVKTTRYCDVKKDDEQC